MRGPIIALLRRDAGATAIEYSLIAGCIALVIIASVALVGADVMAMFQSVDFAP